MQADIELGVSRDESIEGLCLYARQFNHNPVVLIDLYDTEARIQRRAFELVNIGMRGGRALIEQPRKSRTRKDTRTIDMFDQQPELFA